jgi:methylglyoxal synthase
MPDRSPAPAGRRIALIAHDNKKRDMLEWAEYNLELLTGHELFATATTGHRVAVVCNIPVACNRATADFIISSPLMGRQHQVQDPASGQARHNRAALRVARAGITGV